MARWLAALGTSWAIVVGIVGGLLLTLLVQPVPAFSCDQVFIISWRGDGDSVPANASVTGWSAPMFYTTPEEGATPAPPTGKYPTGVWAPGDTMERSLMVKNLDEHYSMRLSQLQVDLSGTLALAHWITLTIRGPDGATLYSGGLTEDASGPLLALNPPVLVSRGGQEELTFAVSLDRNTDQRLQGKSLVADFTLVASQQASPMVIDIHPASWPNPINPDSNGNTPVAINGSATFDVHNLEWPSARFGPGAASPLWPVSFCDWNEDGYIDMVLHFDTPSSDITCGMTEATLTILSSSGEMFEGSDAIITPSCH